MFPCPQQKIPQFWYECHRGQCGDFMDVWVAFGHQELDLTNPKTFRNLAKPMGAQTDTRLTQYKKRYKDWEDPNGKERRPSDNVSLWADMCVNIIYRLLVPQTRYVGPPAYWRGPEKTCRVNWTWAVVTHPADGWVTTVSDPVGLDCNLPAPECVMLPAPAYFFVGVMYNIHLDLFLY